MERSAASNPRTEPCLKLASTTLLSSRGSFELLNEDSDPYLEMACGENAGLRDRMAKLLLVFGDSDSASDSKDIRETMMERSRALQVPPTDRRRWLRFGLHC